MSCFLRAIFLPLLMILANDLVAQESGMQDSLVQLPKGFENAVDKKIHSLDHKLTQQSSRYVSKLSRQEATILKQLSTVDSAAAASFLKESRAAYDKINHKLANAGENVNGLMEGQYMPYLDSLQGSLGFLKDAKNIVSKSKDLQQKLGNSLQSVQQLQGKISEVANIQQLLQERQSQLKKLLSNYSNLPGGITKRFGKYQQEAYYYSQQVKEYKELLNDPDKLFAKTLEILRKVPAFQNFMSKHSMLASLFPTPQSFGTSQALNGLQTRANVQAMLPVGLPVSSTGQTPNPAQYVQDQMKEAKGVLGKVKEKLNELGVKEGGSTDMAMPNYRPNEQRTKSFWKRLEYSSNFQTQRSNQYFPVTTAMALTAGYKLSDKATVGVGVSGMAGWGKSWKQIRLSAEGVGFRSFVDWKTPDLFKSRSRFMASLWFTAGAELNYNKKIEELSVFKNYSTWNKSALAGLTKKYNMNSPLKKGKKVQGSVQVLYDFLHRQHIPHTPAFVWRAGWGL